MIHQTKSVFKLERLGIEKFFKVPNKGPFVSTDKGAENNRALSNFVGGALIMHCVSLFLT